MATGTGSTMEYSGDSEMVELVQSPMHQGEQELDDSGQHEESPSRQSTPGPEKKLSKYSIVDTMQENDDDQKFQDQENSENDNVNGSIGLDWQMEQDGRQRDWFRAALDCYNQFRFNCGMFVNNGHVQFLIVILISINALMMGIGTFDFVKLNPDVDNVFEIVDLTLLIVFTVELGLQFVYHGWRLILDGWLVFDLIIIVTSWSFSSVQIIRAFRIFRALRLVTRIKIMKDLLLGTRSYR